MDVVILGGGVVGLVMANLLVRHQQLQVALIEPNLPVPAAISASYDLRCSAISKASQNILQHLNVWNAVSRMGSFAQMRIWDDELHHRLDFAASEIGLDCLGYVIENKLLINVLYQRLLQYKNVQIVAQKAKSLKQDAAGTTLVLEDAEINCQLLIGADGANSWVRKTMRMPQYGWDYKHSALVGTVRTEYPHANIARQRFTHDSILAFLPLQESDLCSIVWSTSTQQVQSLMAMEASEFNVQLSRAFSHALARVELVGMRASFALQLKHAQKYIAPGICLLGDAAHVIHPMAGQGLNLGIMDAAWLAQVLEPLILQASPLNNMAVLRKYERNRRAYNTNMIVTLEMLKRSFKQSSGVLAMLRRPGLAILNHMPLAKSWLMRCAMGAYGEFPNIARL